MIYHVTIPKKRSFYYSHLLNMSLETSLGTGREPPLVGAARLLVSPIGGNVLFFVLAPFFDIRGYL